ncbi:hypothetical protein [Agromyces aureus]|nr:hypothetical protein [Agromyces aureus]
MKRLLLAAATLLLLAGCSASPASPPEPTETSAPVSANVEACETFGEVTVTVGKAVTGANALETDIPAEFDKALLIADGDVKTRIQALVDNLPEPPHMIVWMDNRDAYSEDVEAVARACEADGADAGGYATLVAANQ